MNQKFVFCIAFLVIICCDAGVSSAAVENSVGDFDDANKTLTIYNNKVPLMSVRLISAVPDLCTFTEVFEVINFEAYIPDSEDFTARTDTKVGSGAVTKIKWFIEQNVSYVVNVTDYDIKQVEKEIYNNKTGKNETVLVDMTVIVGYHDETRYKDVWADYQPYDKVMSNDQVQKIKVVYYKTPELGPFYIQTVPVFRGVECPELTWWSGSWDRRRELIINHSMVDADMTNFPVMVSIIQLGLNTDGNDTRITDSSGNQVAREIEYYNATSGELVFFFNGTFISSISDTGFWMYYNNSDVIEPAVDSTYGSQAVWNDYVVVSHMRDITISTVKNSVNSITMDKSSADNPIETAFCYSVAQDFSSDSVNGGYNSNYLIGSGTIEAYLSIDSYLQATTFIGGLPYGNGAWNSPYIGFALGISASDNIVWFGAVGGTYQIYPSTSNALSTGTDLLIAISWDETMAKTYLNGALDGSSTNEGSGAITYGTEPKFVMGDRSIDASGEFFDGQIGEFRMSSSVHSVNHQTTTYNNLNNPTATGTYPFFLSFGVEEEYVAPTPTPTPALTTSVSPVQYDELDLPLILYILIISMLYLLIVFRHGVAAVELSLIYLIFAFVFLLFQTVTISVNYIYLILFLLLFMISIAGITLEKRSW